MTADQKNRSEHLLWFAELQRTLSCLVELVDICPEGLKSVLPLEVHAALSGAGPALLASVPAYLHGPLLGELPITTPQPRSRKR